MSLGNASQPMDGQDSAAPRAPDGPAREAMRPGRKRWWSRDSVQEPAFLWPSLLFLLCLTLFPFVYSVWLSLHYVRLTRLDNKVFAGVQNYLDLFADEIFMSAIRNTLMLAGATLTIELILGFAIAKVFYELAHRPWVNSLRSAYLVPMMVTPITIGVIANYVMNPQLGILNQMLGSLSIDPVAWFGDPLMAKLSILLINVWQWTPFVAVLLLAGLMSIRHDVLEAARVDGARWYHIMAYIEIPSILPIALLAVILRLIEILRFFDIVYITTRGGPSDATMVMTLFTYQQDFQYFQVGLGSASAVIILAMSIVITTFAVALLRRIEQ